MDILFLFGVLIVGSVLVGLGAFLAFFTFIYLPNLTKFYLEKLTSSHSKKAKV